MRFNQLYISNDSAKSLVKQNFKLKGFLVTEIQDKGLGICSEDLQNIFSMFNEDTTNKTQRVHET